MQAKAAAQLQRQRNQRRREFFFCRASWNSRRTGKIQGMYQRYLFERVSKLGAAVGGLGLSAEHASPIGGFE